MDIEITFEKSAAPFIMAGFCLLEKKCQICGTDISQDNLGGVVKMGEKPRFICDSHGCLLVWASAK